MQNIADIRILKIHRESSLRQHDPAHNDARWLAAGAGGGSLYHRRGDGDSTVFTVWADHLACDRLQGLAQEAKRHGYPRTGQVKSSHKILPRPAIKAPSF